MGLTARVADRLKEYFCLVCCGSQPEKYGHYAHRYGAAGVDAFSEVRTHGKLLILNTHSREDFRRFCYLSSPYRATA